MASLARPRKRIRLSSSCYPSAWPSLPSVYPTLVAFSSLSSSSSSSTPRSWTASRRQLHHCCALLSCPTSRGSPPRHPPIPLTGSSLSRVSAFSIAESPQAAALGSSPLSHSRHLSSPSSLRQAQAQAAFKPDATVAPLGDPPPLNEAQVPLISPHLRSQLFPPPSSPYSPPPPSSEAVKISLKHLAENGLVQPDSVSSPRKLSDPAVSFTLPALQGPTLSHHFHALGHHAAEPYLSLAKSFASVEWPTMPEKGSWACVPGWARYSSADGCWESVEYPSVEDEAVVFDVETLHHRAGSFPIMAVAVGKTAWYGWCSPWLTGDDPSPNHLIPFGPAADKTTTSGRNGSDDFLSSRSVLFERAEVKPRLIIGHNVLFDRARIASEYESLRRPSTRFIDTLSLHVAVSGLTNPQRPQWLMWRAKEAKKDQAAAAELGESESIDEEEVEDLGSLLVSPAKGGSAIKAKKKKASKSAPAQKTWKEMSSMNSLAEVARLHCGITIDKSIRDILINPATTLEDVRSSFDDLMDYCAHDVLTTARVYQALLPKFLATCPHPVSFAGVLLMSQPVLPVDSKWPQYIERAESTYVERLTRVKDALKVLAEEARAKMEEMDPETNELVWQRDVWLRQLDWSLKKARRMPGQVPSKQRVGDETPVLVDVDPRQLVKEGARPSWFAAVAGTNEEPEPKIDFQTPLAAALLRTSWRGHPVVYSHSHGYLFVVRADQEFEPLEKETLVESLELGAKDGRIADLEGVRLYAVPGLGKGRCLKIFGRGALKRVQEGSISCDLDTETLCETLRATNEGPPEEAEAKLAALAKVAATADETEQARSIWFQQLDWSLVPLSKNKISKRKSTRLARTSEVDASLLQAFNWPKWYWELDLPGLGLDVSVRKRAVPLLLRLRWRGFPIVFSKQHGWIYRVPLDQAKVLLASDGSLKQLEFTNLDDTNFIEDSKAIYFKLPHPNGEDKNVGSPLSKSFVQAFEDKILTSDYEVAQDALSLNASCSYWASSRERITNQFVVWEGQAKVEAPTPAVIAQDPSRESTRGLILPQVIPMGTITRRAVEKTWLTASNAKKNRVGSELKSMIRAPPGYAIVGADVDSEELWICSVMGDAQFGLHGATAIGWMTLEGTKSAGTDLHSKTASILGISRDDAKVFNYSRIYGAGVKHAVQLLLKANPTLSTEKATELAKNLYAATKGLVDRTPGFRRNFWHGGTESFVFNKLEGIAQSDRPRTPALGCGLTDALTKAYLPAEPGRSKKGEGFMPSRINWVVQSSGVDYLHLLLVGMEYLTKRYEIDARYMISVHDEIRYLVKEEDKYRVALALQIANLWTRSLFAYRLQMPDLPQGCAFFSAVDIDHCFRKEVNMTCVTPSNPDAIPFGESVDIVSSLSSTQGGSLFPDGRPMTLAEEARLPRLKLGRELSEEEWRGELHRVEQVGFLEAQTSKSKEEIAKLWKSTMARPASTRARHAVRTSSRMSRNDWRDLQAEVMVQETLAEEGKEEEEEDYFDDLPEDVESEFSQHMPAIRSRV